jgi:glucan biosynthesis protein C
MPPQKTHLHFLDALRVFAFLLVIPFHTAMLFTSFGWEVKVVERMPWLDWPIIWLHQWRLPLLFMVSGMGVAIALQKRTYFGFITERTKRLLIPLLVALPLVIMPQQFTSFMYQGYIIDGAPYQFLVEWAKLLRYNWELYHLWFVEYLLVITVVLSPLLWGLNKFKPSVYQSRYAALGWLIFLVSLIGWEWHLRPLYPETNEISNDWANLSLFTHCILGGFLLMKQPAQISHFEKSKWYLLLIGAGLLIIEMLAFKQVIKVGDWLIAGRVIGIICLVLSLLGLATAYFTKPVKWVTYLNGSLYPVYIWHQTIIVILGYEIGKWHLDPIAQFVFVMMGTIIFCYTLYEGLLKPYRWIGLCFGLKSIHSETVSANKFRLTGIALVSILAINFVPRTMDGSLTKPIELPERFNGYIPVTITAPKAEQSIMVPLLVGSFTDGVHYPFSEKDKHFELVILLKPGIYNYRLLLNGKYQTNPLEQLSEVDSIDGIRKSVLVVK